MESKQVQLTNDSSIVSKLSSAKAGYFHDLALSMFVDKNQKRSAIINRGYYIRFKAIEMAFESWFSVLTSTNSNNSQIISLGAGFDSSYFRLKYLNKLPLYCKYIEIDFPPVMKRKTEYILKNNLEIPDLKLNVNHDKCSSIVASTDDYIMLGIDLKNTSHLEDCFKSLDVDFEVPTLFISECAVTYMDVKSSNELIKWIQNSFHNSAFVAYEQVHPFDGFGIVMRNHFSALGCSLKSLLSFPTEEKQSERYKSMGWSACNVLSMFDFFERFPNEEKERILLLELFDEYEMWHEKCHHYVLLWACQGSVKMPDSFQVVKSHNQRKYDTRLKWFVSPAPELFKRFGHQAILLPSQCLLLSGGFGPVMKKHQRLDGLTLFHLPSSRCYSASLSDPLKLLSKRMFHTMTLLKNGSIVVLGGRSAPKKVFKKVTVLHPSSLENSTINLSFENKNPLLTAYSVSEKGEMPYCSWRHSASRVIIDDLENIVLFGGCTENVTASNECFILNVLSWTWQRVENQTDTPSPRHSHSAITLEDNKVFITCGLSKNECILNSVHILDCKTQKWSTLHVAGLLPRYSHASHYYGDKIFLIGGITNKSEVCAGIGVIDLLTLSVLELSLPEQDPEYPILLSNHSSFIYNEEITIVGGGGNCFSFGTHFNCKSITFKIKDVL